MRHLVLLLLFSVYASAGYSAVTACPDIGAIQSEGVSKSQYYPSLGFLMHHDSTYSTPQNWSFSMGFIEARNAVQAKEKAKALLMTMRGHPVPEYDGSYYAWICRYEIEGIMEAKATTYYS